MKARHRDNPRSAAEKPHTAQRGAIVVASGVPCHCSFRELADPASLKPNPRNPNKHSERQIALLAKIISNQGWRSPIVVSNRSGCVVAGHGRLQAAQLLQVDQVPVDYQHFGSEAEEMAHLVADNRIAELAEIDETELAGLLKELDGKIDLDLTGFDADGLSELGALVSDSDVDAEPQIDRAEELQKQWKTERGQVWDLDGHKLMCGDSTSKQDVDTLLGGAKPHLMVTDPPYGVEYDPKWREAYDGNLGTRACGKVENDNRVDWSEAWALFPGDVGYVWHAGQHASEVQASLKAAGFEVRAQIIWSKPIWVFGRGDYHWQHEPCWYVVRKGKPGHYCGGRDQGTVWEIDNNSAFSKQKEERTGHGTQKPVACMAKPIENNSRPGDIVYEPFSGSGTTIIACERLGRHCRAMEISPGYVAVALQRFQDATGKIPKLVL